MKDLLFCIFISVFQVVGTSTDNPYVQPIHYKDIYWNLPELGSEHALEASTTIYNHEYRTNTSQARIFLNYSHPTNSSFVYITIDINCYFFCYVDHNTSSSTVERIYDVTYHQLNKWKLLYKLDMQDCDPDPNVDCGFVITCQTSSEGRICAVDISAERGQYLEFGKSFQITNHLTISGPKRPMFAILPRSADELPINVQLNISSPEQESSDTEVLVQWGYSKEQTYFSWVGSFQQNFNVPPWLSIWGWTTGYTHVFFWPKAFQADKYSVTVYKASRKDSSTSSWTSWFNDWNLSKIVIMTTAGTAICLCCLCGLRHVCKMKSSFEIDSEALIVNEEEMDDVEDS